MKNENADDAYGGMVVVSGLVALGIGLIVDHVSKAIEVAVGIALITWVAGMFGCAFLADKEKEKEKERERQLRVSTGGPIPETKGTGKASEES